MKLDITKEWFEKNLDKEDKAIVSAGSFSASKLDGLEQPARRQSSEPCAVQSAFGMLVSLSRRKKGWSAEKLSEQARIDLEELVMIEQGSEYVPEPRTVCQLAELLNLPEDKLLELSGNTVARDKHLQNAAVKFAARAQSMEKLSREEKTALEEFVKQMSGGSI
jgi:HTH-type transcriptional regulator, competence development regulator